MVLETLGVPETKCPKCGQVLDATVNMLGDEAPEPGNLSVCAHCTAYLVFNDDLTQRLMSDEEFIALPYDIRHKLFIAREVFLSHKKTGEGDR